MITIIVEFTEREKAAIDELESRYEKLFSELDAIINARQDEPDPTLFDEGNAELKRLQDALPPEPIPHDVWSEYKAKEQAIAAEQDRKYNEWFMAGGEAWVKAKREKDAAINKLNEERAALYAAAERRQFSELGTDIKAVLNDAKSQARQLLYNSHQYYAGIDKPSISYKEKHVPNATRLLNASTMRGTIYKALKLHIELLKTDEAAFKEFTEFVNQLIKRSEFIDRASAEEMGDIPDDILFTEIIERAPSKKKAAEYIGAITEMGERALSITDRHYQFALSTRKNKTAYLIRDKKLIESLEFNDGRLSLSSNGNSSVEVRRGDDLGEAEIDLQLLKSLFTAIYYNAESATEDTVTVYVPTLCKHLGVNITSGKAYPLFDKINAFNDCVGVFGNGDLYALLKLIKYDKEQNLMTFASPYMNKLILDIAKRNKKTLKSGDVKILPAYSYLIHSNIANERNKVAVEIVHVINSLIFQRGFDSKKNPRCRVDPTDGAVITEAHISFNTILDYVPELQRRIEGSTTNNAKNAQLKRAFSKAYELLRTKTDIYKNYIDLKIPDIIPTVSTLNTSLNITYKGLDPNYKSKK